MWSRGKCYIPRCLSLGNVWCAFMHSVSTRISWHSEWWKVWNVLTFRHDWCVLQHDTMPVFFYLYIFLFVCFLWAMCKSTVLFIFVRLTAMAFLVFMMATETKITSPFYQRRKIHALYLKIFKYSNFSKEEMHVYSVTLKYFALYQSYKQNSYTARKSIGTIYW